MKKRLLSLILVFAIVFSFGFCLTCCSKSYTVTIISTPIKETDSQSTLGKLQAEKYNKTYTKQIKEGGIVGTIDIPMPDYLEFGGWYTDASFTYQWNTATDTVKGDMTLYAKWIKDE